MRGRSERIPVCLREKNEEPVRERHKLRDEQPSYARQFPRTTVGCKALPGSEQKNTKGKEDIIIEGQGHVTVNVEHIGFWDQPIHRQ
jgi:hypothetical protein